jgi:hypothetical protein
MNDLSVSTARAKRASVDTGAGWGPFIMPHLNLIIALKMPPGKHCDGRIKPEESPLGLTQHQMLFHPSFALVLIHILPPSSSSVLLGKVTDIHSKRLLPTLMLLA